MKSHIKLIIAMAIFGTIGVFRKMVPISSQMLVFYRSILGTLFIFFVNLLRGKRFLTQEIKNNLQKLFISGIALALNWILLFEAYEYTTVAAATVCYYFSPMIVVLLSPILLRERLTISKVICLSFSFVGIIMISDLFSEASFVGYKGILLALCAAILYASVIFMNKSISVNDPYLRTGWQFFSACITMLVYLVITGFKLEFTMNYSQLFIVLLIGILHTGIAYILYFQSIKNIDIQTTALLSYLDPAISVVCSCFILQEKLTFMMVIGSVMVLSSSAVCEILQNKKK